MSRAGASASWPLAMQLQLTIALAALASPVGAVTAYTYAFFIAAIAFNITGASLGLVTLPGLVADLARRGRAAVLDYLGMTAPLGTFLYVPIAGAYAACGLPMLRAVLDRSLSPETILLLWDVSRILLVMGLVWTMLSAVSNAALSLQLLRGLTISECDRDRRADRRAPRPAGRGWHDGRDRPGGSRLRDVPRGGGHGLREADRRRSRPAWLRRAGRSSP